MSQAGGWPQPTRQVPPRSEGFVVGPAARLGAAPDTPDWSIPGTPGPALARGRTAQIHAWAPGWVVKLYHPFMSASDAHMEQEHTRAALAAGAPAPATGPVVQVGNRWGLVMAQVAGSSMMARLEQQHDDAVESARNLAALHRDLLRRRAPVGLPELRARLRRRLQTSAVLAPDGRQAALEALDRLPPGEQLCHGDFHPGNVLVSDKGPVIIDWIDAAQGPAAADVARTLLLCDGSIATSGEPTPVLTAMRDYRQAYLDGWGGDDGPANGWRSWTPVLAAARLSEPVPEQHAWLTAQMRRGLGLD